MTVGLVGGVPPVMGGGGLEVQIAETTAGLQRLGHVVRRVESFTRDERFDVLHGFHAEPALWQLLPHWTRNRVPLVVSPVLPVGPGREQLALAASSRIPYPLTTARMRRHVFRGAAAIVALTEFERELVVRAFGGPRQRTHIVGNGVSPVVLGAPPAGLPDRPFALMVGNVSPRKRQLEVVRAAAGSFPLVIAGGVLEGVDRAEFEALLARGGAVWLGEVTDLPTMRAVQRAATAFVLMSDAEALSLAVLESLSVGTPVIVSDLPSHRELAQRHPGWVHLVEAVEEIPAAFAAVAARRLPAPPPAVPSWDDVAGQLTVLYSALIGSGGARA